MGKDYQIWRDLQSLSGDLLIKLCKSVWDMKVNSAKLRSAEVPGVFINKLT